MVATGGKPQTSAATPKGLIVQKFAESRASELEALHSIVSSRSDKDFRSHRNKRRRTTGHDDRIARNKKGRKKRKFVAEEAGSGSGAVVEDGKRKLSRRVRRRNELIKNARSDSGFSTSGDGTKRLRTHVWHAKRFTMTKIWGFHLPLCKQGRGKGSRALLKKLKHGALVHDASYYHTIQLEGPEDLLLSILRAVLEPCPSMQGGLTSQKILSGDNYGRGILHRVGALSSQIVAPVTYLWRPHLVNNETESQNIDVLEKLEKVVTSTFIRQLWLLLHPAALEEGYKVLKSACEMASSSECPVNCSTLEDKLAKLEIIGFGAFQLIQKILRPVSGNHWALRKCTAGVDDVASATCSYELKNEEEISGSAVISLVVNDPRSLVAKENVDASGTPSGIFGGGDARLHAIPTLSGISEGKLEIVSSSSCSGPTKSNVSELVDLWDTRKIVIPPVAESVLCMEKYRQRLKEFCISGRELLELNAPSLELNAPEEKSSLLCHIMLLKNNVQESSVTRWSIILPLSWQKVFWDAAVLNGAQAIGVSERRWVACEVGLAYFPSDFPDSNAYSCFKRLETTASHQKAIRCPPATSCMKVPIMLPWHCIQCSFHKTSPAATTLLESAINSKKPLNSEECDIEMMCSDAAPFDGYVARTSSMLTQKIDAEHLLLFPNIPDGKSSIFKTMKKENELSLQSNEVVLQTKCSSELCFLRVVLHAFREGVFEEGAVVCAPNSRDISLLKNSTEDDGRKLQIPDSLLHSYFVQQQSGKWELEVPKTPEAKDHYRWPIGFITASFVRGSKKPVAVALCEMTLLAHLREEQWKSTPVRNRRKEIYVLVRNLRSTAYRLALATIVLEAQEEDVEYM